MHSSESNESQLLAVEIILLWGEGLPSLSVVHLWFPPLYPINITKYCSSSSENDQNSIDCEHFKLNPILYWLKQPVNTVNKARCAYPGKGLCQFMF